MTAGRCLVLGANGFIGKKISDELTVRGHQVVRADRENSSRIMDVSAPPVLDEKFKRVIFCASPNYKNPQSELDLFLSGALKWIDYFNRSQVAIVFLSTNNVFDGSVAKPLVTDDPNPSCLYGKHKAALEKEVLKNPLSSVVRLTKVIGPNAPPFAKWLESLQLSQAVSAFQNAMISPVSVSYVTECLARVIEKKVAGIIHLSSLDEMSFADVLILAASQLGIDSSLVRKTDASLAQYPRLGRSARLESETSCQRLGVLTPSVSRSVAQFSSLYRSPSAQLGEARVSP